MTWTVANTSNTNTFEYWLTRTNELAHAMTTYTVTADSNTTVGNVSVDGTFAAQTFVANTALRGGNTTISGVLTVSSNVSISAGNTFTIGNSTVNTFANATHIVANNLTFTAVSLGNSTVNTYANSTLVKVENATSGANVTASGFDIGVVTINTTAIDIGNSTVNSTSNSTFVRLQNASAAANLTPTTLVIDTVTVNGTAFYVGNSTINSTSNSSMVRLQNASGTANLTPTTLVIDTVTTNGTSFHVGNSTVNALANSSALTFNGAQNYGATSWYIGSATVNAVANSTAFTLANSTVTYSFTAPTSGQKAADTYFLNANGSWLEATGRQPITYTTTGAVAQEVDNWLLADYYSMEYTATVNDNNANNRMMSKSLVLHDEGAAYYTEYSVIESNTAVGPVSANANATHVRVWFTPVSTNTTIKLISTGTRK